ncbi:MAG TPA: hypothetical protein VHE55_02150 [Fimbriimonadaceae bacterium]|nr:hypothetical protein [Fimbriimonadaceae bacterium]
MTFFTRAITACLLLCACLSSGQTQGGGGSGGSGSGSSGSGWKLSFRTHGDSVTTYTGATPTDIPWGIAGHLGEWEDSPVIAPGGSWPFGVPYGASASATNSGSVDVKIEWQGTGPAPDHLWLDVNSSATWSGQAGSCDDGQGDQPTAQFGGSVSKGDHTIRVQYPGSAVILSYSLEASCAATGDFEACVACGVSFSAAVSDRSATVSRSGAHDEWIDSQGCTNGDSIWSMYDRNNLVYIYNTQHFVPLWSGQWHQYPYPDWPHDNVSVTWHGPDFSYYYTPEYNWDEGLNGILLRRDMPFADTGTPNFPLSLVITDMVDLGDVNTTYLLHLHYCYDEWQDTDDFYVYKPGTLQWWGSIACHPGGTVTLNQFIKSIDTHTTTVSVGASFQFPPMDPWVKMPLSAQVGESQTHTAEFGVGATSAWTAPDNATSATFYTIWKYWNQTGPGNSYDQGGITGRNVLGSETDKANDVCELRIEFYDSTGHDLGYPGFNW